MSCFVASPADLLPITCVSLYLGNCFELWSRNNGIYTVYVLVHVGRFTFEYLRHIYSIQDLVTHNNYDDFHFKIQYDRNTYSNHTIHVSKCASILVRRQRSLPQQFLFCDKVALGLLLTAIQSNKLIFTNYWRQTTLPSPQLPIC